MAFNMIQKQGARRVGMFARIKSAVQEWFGKKHKEQSTYIPLTDHAFDFDWRPQSSVADKRSDKYATKRFQRRRARAAMGRKSRKYNYLAA
jgi:hypothetical protein